MYELALKLVEELVSKVQGLYFNIDCSSPFIPSLPLSNATHTLSFIHTVMHYKNDFPINIPRTLKKVGEKEKKKKYH